MLDGASWCLIVLVRPKTLGSDEKMNIFLPVALHGGNADQGLLHRWFGCRPDSYQFFQFDFMHPRWYMLIMISEFGLTLHLPKVYEQDRSRREHPAGRSALPSASMKVTEKKREGTRKAARLRRLSHNVHFLRVFAVQVQSAPAYWGGIGFSCVFRWFLRKNYKFSNFRAMYTSSNPSHAEAGTSFRNPKWLTDFSNRVRCTWYLPNWKYRNLNFFEQLVLSICFFLESITGSKLQYMNCKL